MPDLGNIVGIIGIIAFVGSVVAWYFNRSIASERIDHLEGLVDSYKEEVDHERERCDRQVNDLQRKIDRQTEQIAHQKGQLDAVTGELGQKIGQAIAKEVIQRVVREVNGHD